MARRTPARTSRGRRSGGGGNALDRFVAWLAALFSSLNDPTNMAAHMAVAVMLLAIEAVACVFIIRRVPYTEIDWVAYMQEVTGYLEGERDYTKLQGDTGPLVYPAGFVYLFAWLKQVTGGSVAAAQYIFAALYLATQALVMALYARTATLPPWSLALLCASRRLHSIFVLRLFNDCWAMLVAYAATLALQSRRWVLAVVLYSLAVSVKMNVLLMAPGVLAVLLKHARPVHVVVGTVLGVVLQVALGAPFLAAYPGSYLARAFELTRVFTFKWSVNWAFLPESAFLSRQLALALLFLHLRLLWSLAQKHWLAAEGGLLPTLRAFFARTEDSTGTSGTGTAPSKQAGSRKGSRGGAGGFEDSVLFLVFSSNIAGIVASRTIHYQFYSWYFHTLPYLLLRSPLPRWVAVVVLAGIELIYNVYPPAPWASGLLLVMHAAVLGATLAYRGSVAAGGSAVAAKLPAAEAAPVGDGPATAVKRRRQAAAAASS